MADAATSLDGLKRLNQLLAAGLAMPEHERSAWLSSMPEPDRAFAPRLAALLQRASAQTDDFLQRPLSIGADHIDVWADAPLQDQAGDTIGPYRLLRELGSGGMACVWLAERVDGALQRQVALKLPRWGVAPGLTQRMARERDILASLAHTHIARLYDAGTTPQGRPWLAMEYIEGAPIDEYCQEQALSVHERVRLFLQVLEAVAHAHARLVVHRDLKPSNILVNASGEVRLLDFGVAKLLEDTSPGNQLTQQLGGLLTPDYAAPEQAGGQAVGVAADVYSLGVVLYELLTRRRPYELSMGHSSAPMQARILAAVVPRASSRAEDPATARALRGDIDAILNKALQKQAEQRWGSADAFAQDLRRHLAGEPVQAQAPSRGYRLRKFVGRHRWGLAATSAIGLSLAVGLGAALWQAHAASVEAQRAEQAKKFIASIFAQARPREGQGGPVHAADLLEVAAQRIENELRNDSHTAAELGVMIGESFSKLGDPARGEAPLRAAVARAMSVHGPSHRLTVRGQRFLAESLDQQLRIDEAARVTEAALPYALAGLPSTAEDAVELLQSRSFQVAKQDQAEPSYALLRQAQQIGEQHLGESHPSTLTALGLLSNTYGRFGQYRQQLDTATIAMQRAEIALGTRRPDITLTVIERWYAEALRRNDRPRDALAILRRVLTDQRALDGAETPRVRNALYQLGLAFGETGDVAEAIEQVQKVVALEAQHNTQANEDRLSYGFALGTVLGFAWRADDALAQYDNMFDLHRGLGASDGASLRFSRMRYARALALAGRDREAVQTIDALLALPDTGNDLRLEALTVLALNHRLQGRAQAAFEQAQRLWNDAARAGSRPRAQAHIASELAAAALALGQMAVARQYAEQALALYSRAQVGVSPLSATAWLTQARVDLAAGKVHGAHNALSALQAAWASANPGSPWQAEAALWLAVAEERVGNHAAALALRARAVPLLAKAPVASLRAAPAQAR